tara:strand:- start:391 stop:660 length:270 start_codon:yes stop_codon:yes gene_type:complete
MIPKYAILEAKDKDSVCPVMIVEGDHEGIVFLVDVIKMSDEGVLSYNYNVLEGQTSQPGLDNVVGDIIVEMLEEQLNNDNRSEHSQSAD